MLEANFYNIPAVVPRTEEHTRYFMQQRRLLMVPFKGRLGLVSKQRDSRKSADRHVCSCQDRAERLD